MLLGIRGGLLRGKLSDKLKPFLLLPQSAMSSPSLVPLLNSTSTTKTSPETKLIQSLLHPSLRMGGLVRPKEFHVQPNHPWPKDKEVSTPSFLSPKFSLYAFRCADHAFRKAFSNPPAFPTLARGLFARPVLVGTITTPPTNDSSLELSKSLDCLSLDNVTLPNLEWEIVIRGYDKFFNVNELPQRTWSYLEQHATGPFEVSVKENGCIIYASALDGQLIVTSKHAWGQYAEESVKADNLQQVRLDKDLPLSHAGMGELWIHRHLATVGATAPEMVEYLASHRLTAAFELVDDEFEEHILEYPKERRGLYLHGLNRNSAEFISLGPEERSAFALRFGFQQVQAQAFPSLKEVRAFVEPVKLNGIYQDRPIEGFVVRCQMQGRHVFIKVKCDHPYLLFREWREVTLAILKNSKAKATFPLTRRYISWVKDKRRTDPDYFKHFSQFKGVIAARNDFLAYAGIKIEKLYLETLESAATATLESGQGPLLRKVLILPIATIGAGKTCLGRTISHLLPSTLAHIQSDNIIGGKPGPKFEQNVIDAFGEGFTYVYADKNNHNFAHRQSICRKFLESYPHGQILALDWAIDQMDQTEVLRITTERVLLRGENHQSITPKRTPHFAKILRNFIEKRDPLVREHESDKSIHHVARMDISAQPVVQVKAVFQALQKIPVNVELSCPSDAEIQEAFDSALAFQEPVVQLAKPVKPIVSLYGIMFNEEVSRQIMDSVASLIAKLPGQQLKPWLISPADQLHITLAVASKKMKASSAADRHASAFAHYTTLFEASKSATTQVAEEVFIERGVSEAISNIQIDVECIQLVYNDRIAAIQVKLLNNDIPCGNAYPHITIARRDEEVLAMESNALLESLYGFPPSSDICSVSVQPCRLTGHLGFRKFY